MTQDKYAACIQACVECAMACEHCADSCLSEQDVGMMVECIRLDGDCSAMCWMAAKFMSRDSEFALQFCGLCAEVCEACGAECGKHDHDHCRKCAEACRRCAQECRGMAG
ncbi:MAG: four-helix bundle copper-binding protein [Pirellulaceae bacterium]